MLRLSYLGSHFNTCIRKCLHTWRYITNDIRNHFFFFKFQVGIFWFLERLILRVPTVSHQKTGSGGFTHLVPPSFLSPFPRALSGAQTY